MRPIPRLPFLLAGFVFMVMLWAPASAHAQFRRFPYPYPYVFDHSSNVRIEVTPKETEVFVDGYYAGVADDFDGAFQRLRVPPGDHEIELYLNGYRTVREKVYLPPRVTFRLRRAMEPLAPGETGEPRPTPLAPPPSPAPAQGPPDPRAAGGPPMPRTPRGGPPPPTSAPTDSRFGTLVIRVQPVDADVLIDGERWRGPEGIDERLVIQVSEGRHRVEIRKDGYQPFATEIDIRRGETTPLNVSLPPGGN